MIHNFNHVKIEALVGISGTREIDVLDFSLEHHFNERKTKRMISSLGFEKLRLVNRPLTISDLCVAGALSCIKHTNSNIDDIGVLIFVSQSPDYMVPSTTYTMQSRIGLNENTIMLDLHQGCSGFVYGLFYASTLIELNVCKKVLVCVGDLTDFDGGSFDSQISNALQFGDGAGVALLSYSESENKSSYLIKSYGEKHQVVINPTSGFRYARAYDKEKVGSTSFHLDGAALVEFELDVGVASIKELAFDNNTNLNDLNYIFIHQSNKAVINSMAASLSLNNEKVPFLAQYTGNTSSASIPLGISENISKLDSLTKGKSLLCGIGTGLSCVCGIVDLSNTKVLPALYI